MKVLSAEKPLKRWKMSKYIKVFYQWRKKQQTSPSNIQPTAGSTSIYTKSKKIKPTITFHHSKCFWSVARTGALHKRETHVGSPCYIWIKLVNEPVSNPNSVNKVTGCTPNPQGATTHKEDGGEVLRGYANQRSEPMSKAKEQIKNEIKVADQKQFQRFNNQRARRCWMMNDTNLWNVQRNWFIICLIWLELLVITDFCPLKLSDLIQAR